MKIWLNWSMWAKSNQEPFYPSKTLHNTYSIRVAIWSHKNSFQGYKQLYDKHSEEFKHYKLNKMFTTAIKYLIRI